MIRLSTGLRGAMVGDYGLRAMMYRGHIQLYTGPQPESADAAPTGTLLARISQNGATPVAGFDVGGLLLTQDPSTLTLLRNQGPWVLTGLANGVPGWWRFVWNLDDPGVASLFYPRIDGSVEDTIARLPAEITSSTVVSGIQFNFFHEE